MYNYTYLKAVLKGVCSQVCIDYGLNESTDGNDMILPLCPKGRYPI